MAMDKVGEFLRRLESDESLAVKADDALVAGLHALAQSIGYAFSEEELRVGMDAAAQSAVPDGLEGLQTLSDEEMDQVVGAGMLSGATADTLFAGIASDTVFAGIASDTLFAGIGDLTRRFSSFSRTGFYRR